MPEITRETSAKVVSIDSEQAEKIRNWRMDEEDFMRRSRSARSALNEFLQSLAGQGNDFELDATGRFMWVTIKRTMGQGK